jgi:hypothetical protein
MKTKNSKRAKILASRPRALFCSGAAWTFEIVLKLLGLRLLGEIGNDLRGRSGRTPRDVSSWILNTELGKGATACSLSFNNNTLIDPAFIPVKL